MRLDISSFRPVRWLLRRRWLRPAVQLPSIALLAVILWAGFCSAARLDRNPAIVTIWAIWLPGLSIAAVLAGSLWCFVCPWIAVSDFLQRLAFFRVGRPLVNAGLKWPGWLDGPLLAAFLLFFFVIAERGFGITVSPISTAYFGVVLLLLVIVPGFFFQRDSFCRHGCFVGRMTGVFASLSPVELRPRKSHVCESCKTKDCFNGNDRGRPCPTFLNVGELKSNGYCLLCTECVKSCPYQNTAVKLRVPGVELFEAPTPTIRETLFIIVMYALVVFHALSFLPDCAKLVKLTAGMSVAGLPPFFVLMAAMAAVTVLAMLAVTAIAGFVLKFLSAQLRFADAFGEIGRALIPVVVALQVARSLERMHAVRTWIVAFLADPFGMGWNILGLSGKLAQPLLQPQAFLKLDLALVAIGGILAVAAAVVCVPRNLPGVPAWRIFRVVVIAAVAVCATALSAYLLMNAPR